MDRPGFRQDGERLLLRIQGRAYADLFGLVERFIGPSGLGPHYWLDGQCALAAMIGSMVGSICIGIESDGTLLATSLPAPAHPPTLPVDMHSPKLRTTMIKLTDIPPGLASARSLLHKAVLLGSALREAAMPVLASAYIASMGRPSPTLSFMLALAIELGQRTGLMPHFCWRVMGRDWV
jgi:hypothetical protein